MLLAGDEVGNSQGGNNNAYAQDNEIGWIDWSQPDLELRDFVRTLISVRRRVPVLRQRQFLHGSERDDGFRDAVWSTVDGAEPTEADWHNAEQRAIAVTVRGAPGEHLDDVACIIINAGPDVDFTLPDPGEREWRVEFDTARTESPAQTTAETGARYPVLAQSVVVFTAG